MSVFDERSEGETAAGAFRTIQALAVPWLDITQSFAAITLHVMILAAMSTLDPELRAIALATIKAELLELTASRVPKRDQVQFAFGVVYMAHELGAITDAEYDGFEALITRVTTNQPDS